MADAIVAHDLTRRFGDVTAVDHVDLVIPEARIYGFLGPNGSGKSTTLRMLCGLLTPSEGAARVLGHSVPEDAERLKLRLGYMTQRFSLYDDLSVAENLSFVAEIYGLGSRDKRRRIEAALSEYRLESLAGQRAGTMSGGQRQRLALAAATLHRPDLLLLDEPTSAVDPQSRRDFWDSLFQLVDAGTTILVSTHYMDEAERCHRLAILDRGRLVAEGAPRELARAVDAAVVEVHCERPRRALHVLSRLPRVTSATQLGARLHVLVDRSSADPLETVRSGLAEEGIESAVDLTTATLEDVFVVATAPGRERRS